MTRTHNFNAGPGALPVAVLEQMRDELVDFRGSGMSLLEMSHRGPIYEAIHNECIADLKALLGLGDDRRVLFMGGGARTQFSVIPLNLLPKDGFAEYHVTGTWAEGAYTEGKRLGDARATYSSAATGHDRVPRGREVPVDSRAAYLHYTSNNTIYGTQYHEVPETGGAPLFCDMSSDILSRPIDASRYELIYAGAQKNMGPAGATVIILTEDTLGRCRDEIPPMWSFKKFAAENSLLNTPPVFAIYSIGLVMKWLLREGGLGAMEQRNRAKAARIYGTIDESGGFYRGHAQAGSRSWMNICFRLPSEDLDKRFLKEADAAGLVGLKGHRSVGGMRASLYNAVTPESTEVLASFMGAFARRNG